jgi:hypothetical protein
MKTSYFFQAEIPELIEIPELSETAKGIIQEQIDRFKQEYKYLLNCRFKIQVPGFQPEGLYQIQLVLTLPDRDLTIERYPNPDYYQEDLYVAIWSAFDLAKQQLKEHLLQCNYGVAPAPIQCSPRPPIRPIRRCRGYAQG